ncbi:MAG: AMP-binding protein [Micromonosporaceae bacterium]
MTARQAVVAAITAHANQRPGAPALLWQGETVSYGELVGLAGEACHRLSTMGPGPIALPAAKSLRSVALILACLAAGRPFLLPPADLGAETLRQLTRVADCGDFVTPEDVWPAAGPAATRRLPAIPERSDTDFCFKLTTSGSTGLPKIVPLSTGAVDRFTDWACRHFGLGPDRVVLNYAPLNFDLCLLDIWATLRAGGAVALVEPDRTANPARLRQLLADTAAGVVQGVPLLFRLLQESGGSFPDVTTVILTGDHAPARLRACLPGLFPAARFFNVYGCTETNDSFCHEFRPGDSDEVLPIGAPLPGVEALLVVDGAVVDGPGVGELVVRTPFQTSGYLGDGRNAERFVPRPRGGAGIWYRTGDLVRREPSGRLTVVGRDDFQLKVRGARINLEQIEQSLLACDRVVEAAVIAVPDETAGNKLHAVIRRQGDTLTGLVLRQHCAATLPRVAIPSTFRFVAEPLPRTSTGKVDRRHLARDLQKGAA